MISRKLTSAIVAGAAAIAVGGGSYGIVSATAGSSATARGSATSGRSQAAAGPESGGEGSNARSGPAAGGASGTITTVSASGFTLSTSAGQKMTVKDAGATTYLQGTDPASASAVTAGKRVLVLGTTSGTTITAAPGIVQPPGTGAAAPTAVVPFHRGAPATSRQAGQIPANWSQGSGTIISGTAAGKATEAALAAYPGGVVDRVVQLSNGEYNVHYIGVNWPHHVFVSQNFTVVGAE